MMAFVFGGDLLFDPVDVDRVGLRIDVDEHDLRPGHLDRLGRGDEAVGDRDDLVAGPDAERLQRDEERVGAVRHADAVLDAAVAGERLLELLDERPADERGLRR